MSWELVVTFAGFGTETVSKSMRYFDTGSERGIKGVDEGMKKGMKGRLRSRELAITGHNGCGKMRRDGENVILTFLRA